MSKVADEFDFALVCIKRCLETCKTAKVRIKDRLLLLALLTPCLCLHRVTSINPTAKNVNKSSFTSA